MHRLLIIQPIHADALALLDERDDVAYEVLTDASPEAVLPHVAEVEAITLRAALLPIDVLEAAANLRVISRHGVGYDNVPIDYCTSRGIPVTVVGNVNAVTVAEETMFLMLGAARAGVALDQAVREGDFGARDRITGVELRGRTLLVVGLGRIGREVAARASAFGMHVIAYDPWTVVEASGVELVSRLEDALGRADVVSLHAPLTDETTGLLDDGALDLLPRGAIVVNTARGGLVDEMALVERVRSGHLHGAGLDVFEHEPLAADSPLLTEPRIVLSPHSAALTHESLIAMGLATVRNALAGIDGALDLAMVVNPSSLSGTSVPDVGTISDEEEAST